MDADKVRNIVEAALLAAGRPLKIDELISLFGDEERPGRDVIRAALESIRGDYEGRGIQLLEVASGFRIQIRTEMSDWLSRLWTERPPRYSRALLETLALIAYRQPITRGDIEDIRGVSVSTNIIRTLMERHWIRVVGHRDVPGKPAMYATTREFLDYFGLKRLDDLPSLAELRDFDSLNVELDLADPDAPPAANDAGVVQAQWPGAAAGERRTVSLEQVGLSTGRSAAEAQRHESDTAADSPPPGDTSAPAGEPEPAASINDRVAAERSDESSEHEQAEGEDPREKAAG